MDTNDLSNLLCDLTDIRNTLPDEVKAMPKDNEGTELTIGDLLDDAIATLEVELNGETYDEYGVNTKNSFNTEPK